MAFSWWVGVILVFLWGLSLVPVLMLGWGIGFYYAYSNVKQIIKQCESLLVLVVDLVEKVKALIPESAKEKQ